MDLRALVQKYSVQGPRYTSYPTAPQWSDDKKPQDVCEAIKKISGSTALYLHIPFCESLCYYCGCNIKVTQDHSVSKKYLEALCREIERISSLTSSTEIRQISIGGGTPTYLRVEELKTLFLALKKNFKIARDAEISIEIDPRVTSYEQLKVLRELGVNRVSLGVQDFNPKVQEAIHRIQTYEMTKGMLEECRRLGFLGINLDFIYGLPFQTRQSFSKTVDQILEARADRIALYNYAHVPSLRPHQKILEKFEMPNADERLEIFLEAYDKLLKNGYHLIGMDHFALESDELYQAINTKKLYRNFMGYTVQKANQLIGLGCSAISEYEDAFFQNIRTYNEYELQIKKEGLATFRGMALTAEDIRRKWIIQKIMCEFLVDFSDFENKFKENFEIKYSNQLKQLSGFIEDKIIEVSLSGIKVTPFGRLFVRNVAMVFDEHLSKETKATYSKTL
jgi:oxygen-independent coproporphyrinogen-3 oxidase